MSAFNIPSVAAMLQDESASQYAEESLRSDQRLLREVSERRAAQNASVDTRFTLDPAWDGPTAARFASEKFASSGKLRCCDRPSAPASVLCPLVGYRVASIELLSSAPCAAATSTLSRMWGCSEQATAFSERTPRILCSKRFNSLDESSVAQTQSPTSYMSLG